MREEEDARREAKLKAQKAEEALNISFKSFFDDVFMPDAESRWKPETARKAKEHVANWIHPVTGDTPLREINLTHVKRIRASLSKADRSPRSQQYIFRTFTMVWNTARDHGLVDETCPTKASSFRLPKVDNERQRYLTVDEEKTLLEKIKAKGQQAHDMAVVAVDAGLRFGEVAGLTWGCVDLVNKLIRVINTKSGKDRIVPLTERLTEMFEGMAAGKPNVLVFPNNKGNRQTQIPSSFKRGVVYAKLNEGVDDPKMKVSFHTLRHTCASRLVQSGADLYRVQRLLGHSTPVMTARYSKLADDDLRQAVEAMEQSRKIKSSNGKVLPLQRKPKAR